MASVGILAQWRPQVIFNGMYVLITVLFVKVTYL